MIDPARREEALRLMVEGRQKHRELRRRRVVLALALGAGALGVSVYTTVTAGHGWSLVVTLPGLCVNVWLARQTLALMDSQDRGASTPSPRPQT